MFPRYTSRFITPILLLSLLLAGCGSSGDAILLGDGGSVPGGNTPVVTATIAGVTFPSIHLEMTDEVTTNSHTVPYLLATSAGVTEVHDHSRAKTTCPSVPPRGNQCTFTHIVADGVEYGFADQGASHAGSAGDVSLDKHLQFYGRWLEPLERFPASGLFVFGGTRGAREILGGARRYSVFLNNSLSYPRAHQTFGVAFGLLYEGGKPPVGSATWHGIMVG